METLSRWLSVLVALGPAAPALFVPDDAHGLLGGYAAVDEPHDTPAHNKYYIANTNQNIKLVNERAVDSYFRISRASSRSLAPAAVDDRSSPGSPAPARPQKRAENAASIPQSDATDQHYGEDETTASGVNRIKPNERPLLPNRKEYPRKHGVYEKHAVVFRGERNYRPHLAQYYNTKIHSSRVKDRILRKASVRNERNARAMSRLLADITRNALDGNSPYEKGYGKRNTIDKESIPRIINEQYNSNHGRSLNYVNTEDAFKTIGSRIPPAQSPPHAPFYAMNRDAEGAALQHDDVTLYRASANRVDLNVGRKGTPFTI